MEKTQQQLEDFMNQTVEAVDSINGNSKFTANRLTALINILEEKGIIEPGDIRNGLQQLAEERKQVSPNRKL